MLGKGERVWGSFKIILWLNIFALAHHQEGKRRAVNNQAILIGNVWHRINFNMLKVIKIYRFAHCQSKRQTAQKS